MVYQAAIPIATAVGEFAAPYLIKEATKLGIKKFIQNYGSTAFQAISTGVVGGMIEQVTEPLDLQQEKLFGMPVSRITGQEQVYSDIEEPKKVEPLKFGQWIGPDADEMERQKEEIRKLTKSTGFPADSVAPVPPLITPIPEPKKIEPKDDTPVELPKSEGFPIPEQKTWKDYILTQDKPKDITKQTKDLITKEPEFGALTETEKQTALLEKGDKPDYYSRVAKAVEGSQEIATAEQWMGIIQGQGATKVELDYLGLTELLKGKEKITKADLLSKIKEKDLSSRITTTLIPEKDMKEIAYPEYDLGGHGASKDTRVYVMQYDVTKDEEGKYLPHDEPIEYRAPPVHIGKEQYGRNTLATLRVQVGYEGIKELEDLHILNESQSDLMQTGQKKGFVSDWDAIKGSELIVYLDKNNIEYEIKKDHIIEGHDVIKIYHHGTTPKPSNLSVSERNFSMLDLTPNTNYLFSYPRKIKKTEYGEVYEPSGKLDKSKPKEFKRKISPNAWTGNIKDHIDPNIPPDFPIKDSRKMAELMVNEFIKQAILSGTDSIGFANGAILYDRYIGQDQDKAESLAFWQDKMLISSAEKILKKWIKKSGWNESLESLITEHDIQIGAELQKRDILPTMEEMRTEDYFLETVTAKDLLDYIVKNLDPDFEGGQEIPDFISLLDEEGLGVAGDNVGQKLKSFVDSGHGDQELMVYQNNEGTFNFRLPIINKYAAEFHYKDTELGLPEWAKKKFEKDIYQRREAIYAKYVEDYKVETSYGRHKIIKIKLPKLFKEQFIGESKKFTELKLPIDEQTQKLVA
jgi:hypothetical protein